MVNSSENLLHPGAAHLAPGKVLRRIVGRQITGNLIDEQAPALLTLDINKGVSKTEHHLADFVDAIARCIPADPALHFNGVVHPIDRRKSGCPEKHPARWEGRTNC